MRRVATVQPMKLNVDYSVRAPWALLSCVPFHTPSEGRRCPEGGVYSYLSFLYIQLNLHVSLKNIQFFQLSSLFVYFLVALWQAGPYFPDQGLNLRPRWDAEF